MEIYTFTYIFISITLGPRPRKLTLVWSTFEGSSLVKPQMAVVGGRLAEASLAEGTLIGLLSCVGSLMSAKVGFVGEGHFTRAAREGLLSCVDPLMHMEV